MRRAAEVTNTDPARAPLAPRKSGNRGRRAAIRVLHVINGLQPGGAETVLYRLVTYPSDVQHEVICLENRDWYSARLEQAGVKVHHLGWTSAMSTGPLQLFRLIRNSGADVVQAWMYRSNLFAGILARIARKPVIWNIRGSSLEPLRPASRFVARVGGALAGLIPQFVINCSVRSKQLHARLGYDAADGAVIANGYDPEVFYPDEDARTATRKSLGVDDETFLVGTVCRWHPQKGIPVLMRALGLLAERGVPVRLVMVGRRLDSENRDLARLLQQNGCAERVQLLGERSDVPVIARALDLHVLASVGGEGFPNAIGETMLSGTPNVSTEVGDAGLIVGSTGWIVPANDAEHLADAIQQAHSEWAKSPRQWKARRNAARARIAENFTIDRMVDAYEKVWGQVAATAPEQRLAPASSGRAAALPSSRPRADKPLRVLHVINNLGLGGAETLLYRLATRESATKHIIVSMGSPAWYSESLQDQGVRLHHLGVDSLLDAASGAIRLNTIIRRTEADVVQCWMYRSNLFGGLVAKAMRRPVVWGIHCSSLDPLGRGSRALARLGGKLARWTPDYVINCSTRSAELHGALGYSAASVAVIHNGYDDRAFYPDEGIRLATRKALGLSPADFTIGGIARWHRQKDIPNFLRAVRIVSDRGIPFRCFLLGAGLGDYQPHIVDLVEQLGCTDLVTLLGPRSDVDDIARALDLHVLASCGGEAFPNVIAETMLSGTPNAVTDVGDCALMVGETGWVVPPSDPERLADAIIEAHDEWHNHPRRWAARRKAARKQMVDNYSLDRMVQAYDEIWRLVASA